MKWTSFVKTKMTLQKYLLLAAGVELHNFIVPVRSTKVPFKNGSQFQLFVV